MRFQILTKLLHFTTAKETISPIDLQSNDVLKPWNEISQSPNFNSRCWLYIYINLFDFKLFFVRPRRILQTPYFH